MTNRDLAGVVAPYEDTNLSASKDVRKKSKDSFIARRQRELYIEEKRIGARIKKIEREEI